MAIYHLEAKVVSRGAGRSACAAAAYMSCSAIYNDYDGIQHDYTRKQGLVWQQVFLPEYAPAEWQDRAILWNAVEETEKTKDSRLAREFVVALPIELGKDEWQSLVSDFIREQFVSDGMCADCAIHDTDGHNPHAHILLTVRPLDEHGKWQYKTEKEYLCIRNGEERGFTASEFKAAQADGWEKQYPYYVDKKKKEYLPPSEADARGLERADKHPKSTKFGRQNPITERWNSDEQLVLWRSAWADTVNRALEHSGIEERIDHRSHAERGLDEQPTVHEGVEARAMERKGFVSDRCELNRQIKADNALLRELKAQVAKLKKLVLATIPVLANAMETLRRNMIIFHYQLSYLREGKKSCSGTLEVLQSEMKRYLHIVTRIKSKTAERKRLLAEKKDLPGIQIFHHKELSKKIAVLTEELEELRSEKRMLLENLRYDENKAESMLRKDISAYEERLRKLEQQESKFSGELESALLEYDQMKKESENLDPVGLYYARKDLRPEKEEDAENRIRQAFGDRFSITHMWESKHRTDYDLDDYAESEHVRRLEREASHGSRPKREKKSKSRDMERG